MMNRFFWFLSAMFAPPAADPHGPSAPPASMFDSMPGYEGTVAGGGGTVNLSQYCHTVFYFTPILFTFNAVQQLCRIF